jgi:hypothetical protein
VPTSLEALVPSPMREFCIQASGFALSVAGDCPETLGTVRRYLLPWLPRLSESREDADLRFSLTRCAATDRFEVRLNGRVLAQREALPYLFTLVQQAADDAMIRSLRDNAAVHAGVVVHRGKAIVLPGSSGAGKSRLVQELLRCGAEYCSDEYAILDPRGNVYPYPRPLMIRKESDEQHPVLASELHANVRSEPAPVGVFLFLRYEPDATGLHMGPLDRSEALIRLLQNTPHVLADNPEVLEPLKIAIARVNSFAGVRGEVREAAAEILRFAENAN